MLWDSLEVSIHDPGGLKHLVTSCPTPLVRTLTFADRVKHPPYLLLGCKVFLHHYTVQRRHRVVFPQAQSIQRLPLGPAALAVRSSKLSSTATYLEMILGHL